MTEVELFSLYVTCFVVCNLCICLRASKLIKKYIMLQNLNYLQKPNSQHASAIF